MLYIIKKGGTELIVPFLTDIMFHEGWLVHSEVPLSTDAYTVEMLRISKDYFDELQY